MNNLMLDIECAGTERDAALMAMGAVFFDPATYTIGPTFYRPIHVATSVKLGMKIYPETFIWWMRQSDQARSVVNNTYPVLQVLNEFAEFIAEHSNVRDVRPWGNSAAFDLGITGHAYDLAGMERPWHFGKETCFRTVRNMNAHIEYDPTQRKSVHHNALDDALFQVDHLFRIRRANRGE